MGTRHTMFYMDKEYPNIPIGGGAGGGGGGELTLLAGTGDTVMSIGNHTLADSLANYDSVLVCVCYQQYTETGLPPAEYPIDIIKMQATDRSYAHYASLGYCDFRYIDDNTIATLRYSGVSITAIYGIKYGGGSGGGGSQTIKEIIYSNSGGSIPATITLNESITQYDQIVLSGYRNGMEAYWSSITYMADEVVVGRNIGLFDDSYYAWYTVTNDTTLTNIGANIIINKIYGIKF